MTDQLLPFVYMMEIYLLVLPALIEQNENIQLMELNQRSAADLEKYCKYTK